MAKQPVLVERAQVEATLPGYRTTGCSASGRPAARPTGDLRSRSATPPAGAGP
ncbi:hypothetical protein MXD59_09145 [Frankia sp. Ag45/Mut15]|uniref:Uncharacterized protein n=1 Tax=Frankia umida TaxID=573489 RepID=A0ABT0JWL4_9ACTN|nr:hypothetical protein [Frankia umida]MCK9875938.1 hypothetical protein [Frankia umida]